MASSGGAAARDLTRLVGKVAVVTGAARGIGYACCRVMGLRGASVLVSDIDEAALKDAVETLRKEYNIKAESCVCDVTKKEEVDAMIAKSVECFGGVDILVANAGMCHVSEFLDLKLEDFEKVIRTNLCGTFLTAQAAARAMVAQNEMTPGRGGSIITMSSVNAEMAIPQITGYNASKGGIHNLTKNMALALAPHGIRVNAVGPGSIMTRMLGNVANDNAAKAKLMLRTPLQYIGSPDEVGEVVAFLASPSSSYVTGECIFVDGGRRALNYTVPPKE